ncbi:peptidoglycan-binding protein [Primorskyibacter sp. S187A]|uniref:peptidoglycan-binding protein n=1 Tax=Primorskyibacter sp. S187A TaxID=3415130 RepID=UPI003C7C6B2F
MKRAFSAVLLSGSLITPTLASADAATDLLRGVVGAIVENEIRRQNQQTQQQRQQQRQQTAPAPQRQTVQDVRLNRAQKQVAQSALNLLGHNAGVADGVFGKGTRAAIARYQRSIGARTTGYLTARQFNALNNTYTQALNSGNPNVERPLTRNEMKELQRNLQALGYYRGAIDGIAGRGTAGAISNFLTAQGRDPYATSTRDALAFSRSAAAQRPAPSPAPAPRVIAGQPSFDCAKARSQTEFAICGAADLAAFDVALATLYNQKMAMLAPGDQENLRVDQRNWVAQRNQCGGNTTCLNSMMQARLGALAAYVPGTVTATPAPAPSVEQPATEAEVITAAEQAPKTPAQSPDTGDTSAQAPAPVTLPVSTAPQIPSGAWYGSMQCDTRRGKSNPEIEFTLRPRDARIQEIRMVINGENSMSSGTGELIYIGEPMGDGSGKLNFVFERAVRNGIFGSRPDAGFVFDPATGRGTIANGTCQGFSAQQMQAGHPRLVFTTPPPATGGSFWQAATLRDKCEALIAWADKANQEYPGRDFYRQNRQGDTWRLIKIFADDDFIPVFGEAYDSMSLERRKAAWMVGSQECNQDPFTRNRMQTYRAAADRVLPDNPERQLTSNGYSSTVFAIRKIRAARNEINAAGRPPAPGEAFTEIAERVNAVKTLVSENEDVLWPSESKGVVGKLEQRLATLAKSQADAALAQVRALSEPREVFDAIRSASGDFITYLDRADRNGFQVSLRQIGKDTAKTLMEPTLEIAALASNDLAGARQIESLMEIGLRPLKGAPNDLEKTYRAELNKLRDARVSAAIEAHASKLAELSGDKAGLADGVAWLEQLDNEFVDFRGVTAYRTARSDFFEQRAGLVEAALPGFELELQSTNGADEVDALLDSYLILPTDKDLPVALEYAFLAELFK